MRGLRGLCRYLSIALIQLFPWSCANAQTQIETLRFIDEALESCASVKGKSLSGTQLTLVQIRKDNDVDLTNNMNWLTRDTLETTTRRMDLTNIRAAIDSNYVVKLTCVVGTCISAKMETRIDAKLEITPTRKIPKETRTSSKTTQSEKNETEFTISCASSIYDRLAKAINYHHQQFGRRTPF